MFQRNFCENDGNAVFTQPAGVTWSNLWEISGRTTVNHKSRALSTSRKATENTGRIEPEHPGLITLRFLNIGNA